MNAYRRGRQVEYKVKSQLEANGWLVIRSAGSHGQYDLVALRLKGSCLEIVLLQLKKGQPKRRAVIEFWTGNARLLSAVLFYVPRRGAYFDSTTPFSASDPFSVFHQKAGAKLETFHRKKTKLLPRGDRHASRTSSIRSRRNEASNH